MTDPVVIGLDLSLAHTGIAFVNGDVRVVKTDGLDGPERIEHIRQAVVAAAMNEDLELVVVEGYSYGSSLAYAREIGELGGVIRNWLWCCRVPYIEVAPTTLKKVATGNGKASKYNVLKHAEKHLGYQGENDNEADALWLRAIGWELLGDSPVEWTKAQMDGFTVLRRQVPVLDRAPF